MDSSDLAAFIAARALAAEIIHMDQHTPTVDVAAQVLGVPVEQVAKSILFMVNDAPLLVIANGLNRVDYKRLAEHLNLSRKKIRIASPDDVLNLAGFIVGSMPPFGHKTPLPTLLDARLFDQAEVYAGGGDINAMLRVTPEEIARVTGGERVAVTQSVE
jgi:prolyl-tRNA editing enzyme YbaK/EbsC (Cys-tRNA(Pro) deacylase)